ncbi:hypothetical protein K3495_g15357 [Podosphaera aphanis]|nr:hypothetical protein K3495_g15357 [Podosphaera aphanis]
MLLPFKDKRLWAEAVRTFIYTKNRIAHGSVNGQTPYEAFHGTKPSISHLQPFGRECYVHIPMAKQPSGSKLLPKAEKGIFVGYTKVDHHYRIFAPEKRKLIISADVTFPAVKTNSEINNFPADMNNPKQSTIVRDCKDPSLNDCRDHRSQQLLLSSVFSFVFASPQNSGKFYYGWFRPSSGVLRHSVCFYVFPRSSSYRGLEAVYIVVLLVLRWTVWSLVS